MSRRYRLTLANNFKTCNGYSCALTQFKINTKVHATFPFVAPDRPGSPGSVSNTAVLSSELDAPSKRSYPKVLLRLIRRNAEDLLWANNTDEGRRVLEFIKSITSEREDAGDIFKGNIHLLQNGHLSHSCFFPHTNLS